MSRPQKIGTGMKKIVGFILVALTALTLTSCASSSNTPAPAPTPSATPSINKSVLYDNNNTDPYTGWVKKYNDTLYWGDVVFYRCDDNGTATYRTYDPAGGVDVEFNSPDCPAR